VYYALAVLTAGLLATEVSIRALRAKGVVDVPNQRSSHTRTTVRGAGIGVAACAVVAALVAAALGQDQLLRVAVLVAIFAALGFADDLLTLHAGVRLPAQLLLAVATVLVLPPPGGLIWAVLAVIFIVGYVNAFNFMDGINGISGLHAAAIGLTWMVGGLLLSEPLAVLLGSVAAAAALAFLPFNLPVARAFLGDVGSYFFGGWLAISAVLLLGQLPLLLLLLPLLPYVADTAWTLVRRVRRGETLHEAHREHVYQRLVLAGWSHTRTSSLMGALTLWCGAAGIVTALAPAGVAVLAVVAAGAACVLYLTLPRIVTGSEVVAT
jgi:UDP-GlcNAc:undecaprenyl-phosphate/decaprenyl-phosphate GlcNAc-1-phosphate transferase